MIPEEPSLAPHIPLSLDGREEEDFVANFT
jgi:hypothetical protein